VRPETAALRGDAELCGADINEEERFPYWKYDKIQEQVVARYLEDRFADKRPDNRTILKLSASATGIIKDDRIR
jgi:hypothetical protein